MPARFTNVSNSGRARFINVSNSGRAVFGEGGGGGETTTTTTTATPPNTFNIYAMTVDSCSNIDNERNVRTSNNDVDLAAALANGASLIRMPQDVQLTGFNYARMASGGNTYAISSINGTVESLSSTC
jgi:tripartite-type tricarboxylate transporter receptor subunit TctC